MATTPTRFASASSVSYGRHRPGAARGRFIRRKKCRFCEDKVEPYYRKPEVLRNFTSDKGKILPSYVTGVCAKHQRVLSREIKRARILALLPFVQ